MTDQPRDIVIEHLREIRTDIRKLTSSHDHLTAEVRLANAHVAAFVQGEVHTTCRIAELDARISRIEKRLELNDE